MKENKFTQSKSLVIFCISWALLMLYPGIKNIYYFFYWNPLYKSIGMTYQITDLLFAIIFISLSIFFGYMAILTNHEQIIISKEGIKHINIHRTLFIRWDEKPTVQVNLNFNYGVSAFRAGYCTIKTETKTIKFIYNYVNNWKEASSLIDKYRIDN